MIAWGTDSGTHELPRLRIGIPLAEQPTTEIPFWEGLPEVPTPRRSLLERVRRPRTFVVVSLLGFYGAAIVGWLS